MTTFAQLGRTCKTNPFPCSEVRSSIYWFPPKSTHAHTDGKDCIYANLRKWNKNVQKEKKVLTEIVKTANWDVHSVAPGSLIGMNETEMMVTMMMKGFSQSVIFFSPWFLEAVKSWTPTTGLSLKHASWQRTTPPHPTPGMTLLSLPSHVPHFPTATPTWLT